MDYSERKRFFRDNYHVLSAGCYGSGRKIYIGSQERACRFCGRDSTETTFKNDAHAIPEFLGNHQLILLDECDACNKEFSENLEDHLDKYTKPYRTLAHIKGKKKIPKYKSKDEKGVVSVGKEASFHIGHLRSEMVFEETENSFKMKLEFEPHIPAAVFKALVKIAISLIKNECELPAFAMTIKWLREKNHSEYFLHPLTMMRSFAPGFFLNTGVRTVLLRRKPSKLVPYSILVIHFGNWVYQLHVPSHLEVESGQSVTYEVPWFPPFEKDWPLGKPVNQVVDLSASDKQASTESVVFHFEKKVKVESC